MVGINLKKTSGSGKAAVCKTVLVLAAAAAMLLGGAACTEDSLTTLPEDFSYNGSYVILEVSTTRDGVTVYDFDRNAASGLMTISDNGYDLDLVYGSDAYFYGSREDSGYIVLDEEDNRYIDFISQADTTISPRGIYDPEQEKIRINFVSGQFLWTEIWKRVRPVGTAN